MLSQAQRGLVKLSGDRDRGLGFDFFDYDVRMRLRDQCDSGKFLTQKTLIMLHIATADLEQVVKAAGNHMTGFHLGDATHQIAKLFQVVGGGAGQQNLYKSLRVRLEFVGVEERHVLLNVAFFLEPAHAL